MAFKRGWEPISGISTLTLIFLSAAFLAAAPSEGTQAGMGHGRDTDSHTASGVETGHADMSEGSHAAADAHDSHEAAAHGDKVDFPVMKDHLIGRNKFELPNPLHITHPIEIYVPVWIVPAPDELILQDGTQLKGIILSQDEHTVVLDRIMESDGHRYVEKSEIPMDSVSEVRDIFNIDMSLYKQVIMMWVVSLLLILGLRGLGKNPSLLPSGKKQNLVEILILFIRDDVVYPNMGKAAGRRFTPLILTLFFFILLANLLGLVPGTTTATGTVSVTAALAAVTFLTTQLFGNRDYWRHIFATPGVPLWLLPIMIPVEILGMFTKPFALTIRLFANMTAGHIIILAFLGMIINFKSGWIALGAVPMSVAIYMLEIFVAFLQAYIFALLSSIFIGAAVQEHAHH